MTVVAMAAAAAAIAVLVVTRTCGAGGGGGGGYSRERETPTQPWRRSGTKGSACPILLCVMSRCVRVYVTCVVTNPFPPPSPSTPREPRFPHTQPSSHSKHRCAFCECCLPPPPTSLRTSLHSPADISLPKPLSSAFQPPLPAPPRLPLSCDGFLHSGLSL